MVGVLLFFVAAVLLDHWIMPGGLGFWGRTLLFVLLCCGAGWYIATRLLPLLIWRINPYYAAQAIEETRPSLKNSLLNYLWFRQHHAEVPEAIFDALQSQAATGVSSVPIEQTVDRAPIIRLSYVMLAMVTLFAGYFLCSPKNPFVTISRVMLPWTKTLAPSRVKITKIEPGTTTAFRGQTVAVKAELTGLR